MNLPKYDEHLIVPSYLCNAADHLSLAGVAALFQEAAWRNARQLGFDYTDTDSPVFWVLNRLEIQVDKWPRWDQEIRLQSWPSGTRKLFATREFLITEAPPTAGSERNATDNTKSDTSKPAGGETGTPDTGTPDTRTSLIRAGSAWLLLSGENGKPVRPQKHLRSVPQDTPRVLDLDLRKPGSLSTPTDPQRWNAVRPTDIDRNQHVNNTRYFQWIADLIQLRQIADVESSTNTDQSIPSLAPPVRIVVIFHSEARLGDSYQVVMEDPWNGEVRIRRASPSAAPAVGSGGGSAAGATTARGEAPVAGGGATTAGDGPTITRGGATMAGSGPTMTDDGAVATSRQTANQTSDDEQEHVACRFQIQNQRQD